MLIKLENVNYIYNAGTAEETAALRNICLELGECSFTAIAGSTGSGKSTLLQLLNGLLMPSSGQIYYDGVKIADDKKALRELRCRVGLVFQYPEYQLFDETLIKDVTFGPKNKGLDKAAACEMAESALRAVKLPEKLWNKSPFELSGGEQRKAAIAGIIAMKPELLVLDEPTAGLDPVSKREILDLLKSFNKDHKVAVIMVSHNMDEIAEYADRLIAMHNGQVLLDGTVKEVFEHRRELEDLGLGVSVAADLCDSVGLHGPVTIEEAAAAIYDHFS